jgi:GNAT superfamily N-acetyltransferase
MIRVTGLGLPSAFRMTNVWARHEPRAPHRQVGPIAVHPDAQGRGIGKSLLAAFVDRNVALYEKFSFKVIDQEDIAGVNNRFMWRAVGAR